MLAGQMFEEDNEQQRSWSRAIPFSHVFLCARSMSWARLAEMFNVDPKVNQSQEEGGSGSTALDDYQECRSLSHLDILMPVYLIPLLALGLKVPQHAT
ncbi:hypothetical protein MRX96_045700 [Rhipicephalus microplus]